MRIDRSRSRLTFRKRSPRAGCLPLFFVFACMTLVGWTARDWLVQWLGWQMTPATATIQQAQAAFAAGDLDTTISIAARLFDANPADSQALALLVRALIYRSYVDYEHASDRQRALSLARAAYRNDASQASIQGIYAYALQAQLQTDLAVQVALNAIENDPLNVPGRLALSMGYRDQGLFEASLREARKAVEITDGTSPDWRMDARRVLAIAYAGLGRYDDALTSIRQAIDLNRRLIPLHFEHALYARHIRDDSTATAAYFQVIAFDKDNAKAQLRLCEVSSQLREPEAALRYCTAAVERASTWADAWYQLGWEYFLQGDMQQAKTALGQCSTLQVLQNVPVEQRKFECWYIQGQAAEVLHDCETLLPLYDEFKRMTQQANIPQTWTYPPEGPPICMTSNRQQSQTR